MLHSPTVDLNTRKALLFALVAERLAVYYEHNVWMTASQSESLADQWLKQAKLVLPVNELRCFSTLSGQLARQMTSSLSREAGLYAVHEMTEARDPRYQSAFALDMQAECERLLREHLLV